MKVLALLDPPSTKSFGMVPFVGAFDLNRPIVFGLRDFPRGTQITTPLSDLVAAGHAVALSESVRVSVAVMAPPLAAGWIGNEFETNRMALGGPDHHAPRERFAVDGRGSFWIAPAPEVYDCLKGWVVRTSQRAIEKRDCRLARLLAWALPDVIETNAALWYTAGGEAERKRHLHWQSRLTGLSVEALIAEYASFVFSP